MTTASAILPPEATPAYTAPSSWPWFSENGILETIQVVILVTMMVRYLALTRHPHRTLRAIFASGAVVSLACVLREVGFDPEGRYAELDGILKGPVRIAAAVICIPVMVIAGRTLLQNPFALPRLVFGTGWGRCSIAGGCLVILGALFDRGLFSDGDAHQWEEFFETCGFLLIGVFAFVPVLTAEHAIERPLRSSRSSEPDPES